MPGREGKPAISNSSDRAERADADKLIANYSERRSKLAGVIFESINDAQSQLLNNNISTLNIAVTYKKLLKSYKPKTSTSCVSVLQEILTLCRGSTGFENETYQEYGARTMALGSRLAALLPSGSSYTQEATRTVALYTLSPANPTVGATTTVSGVRDGEELATPSTYNKGYSADDLAMSMLILGLGSNDENLCHTLNHLELGDDPKVIFDHLIKADTLIRNTQLQESTASALAAQTKKQGKGKKPLKTCSHHGANTTHDTKDCHYLNGQKKDAAKSASEGASPAKTLLPGEQAMMASISHIRSPAVCRPRHSRHRITANDPWNPDTGTTSHMTGHLKWLRNTVNVRVAVTLANNKEV
ncbi:hypothetical protein MD484_g9019, partial [Candolleomyces efflorescens]